MFLAAHAAPRRRRRFFWTGGAPPPPTEIYRRAPADTMTSAHSSSEAWVVTKEIEQRIMATERKSYRKILRLGWTQKVKKHRFIWSNTARGEYHAETDRQKTRTVWTHITQNA